MLDGTSDIPEFLMRSQSMKSLASSSHDTSSISSSTTTSGGPRCRPPLVIDPMRFRSVEPGESPILCVSRYKASSTIDRTRFQSVEAAEESPVLKTPVVSASTSSSDKQVVVLRVSLHCRGCEGKVRKHISRMKGVTSFNIDFAAKKVTVIGDVTPLGVLASISRVKNAQLWPSSASVSGK
ncbi:hypothetical protein QJS10_CPB20g00873 [Acorus calamus]|uniref:HMA domain-containing protein n=1 Tax=Acorus calamus TaxID=4465 RepID=A0AAV9CAJ9_ACOCL|nr:hypothetical protein QJS10_CPB20g00873 [Acorus calamus]